MLYLIIVILLGTSLTATCYVISEIIGIRRLADKYMLLKVNRQENDELLAGALKIARLRARQHFPLLIKINGYPSVGKTTFINKNAKNYPECKFYDFDKFSGDEKTSRSLLNRCVQINPDDIKIMVLFGCFKPEIESDLNEVIQLTVIPTFPVLCRNIILRKGLIKGLRKKIGAVSQKAKYKRKWENSDTIMRARLRAHSKCYNANKKQIQLIMTSFQEPINMLLKTYYEEIKKIP